MSWFKCESAASYDCITVVLYIITFSSLVWESELVLTGYSNTTNTTSQYTALHEPSVFLVRQRSHSTKKKGGVGKGTRKGMESQKRKLVCFEYQPT